MSVFDASVPLLTMNFLITLSKWSACTLGYPLEDPQLLTKFLTSNNINLPGYKSTDT